MARKWFHPAGWDGGWLAENETSGVVPSHGSDLSGDPEAEARKTEWLGLSGVCGRNADSLAPGAALRFPPMMPRLTLQGGID